MMHHSPSAQSRESDTLTDKHTQRHRKTGTQKDTDTDRHTETQTQTGT